LNGDDPSELLQDYFNAGVPGVARVVVINSEGQNTEARYEVDNPELAEVRDLGEVVAVAMLLQLLPEGRSLTDDMTEKNYQAFGSELRRWHDRPVKLTDKQESVWRQMSAMHPIEGRERLLAIKPYIDFKAGWISEVDFGEVERLMRLEALRLINAGTEVNRVHGDSWRDNVLIAADGQAVLFDNALKYGLAANDIAFAIGDRVLEWLTTGDDQANWEVEAFIKGYGEQNLTSDVFVGLGFKAVVGAAFDEYSFEDRSKIIIWIVNLLGRKENDPNLEFSLDLAKKVWDASCGS
jgi:hypothetical protein